MTLDLEKIEKLQLDYNDLAAIEEFAANVEEAIQPFKVTVEKDGLSKVEESQKFVTKVKNKVAKYFKAKRNDINKLRSNIISAEKLANEPLTELEENLKNAIKREYERQEMELQIAKLPQRQVYLQSLCLKEDDDVLLNLNDVQFVEHVEKLQKQKVDEEARLEVEKLKIKAATEEAEARAKLAEEKLKLQEEERKKIAAIEEANISLIQALKDEVGFNDKEFKLSIQGAKAAVWKLVKVIDLGVI